LTEPPSNCWTASPAATAPAGANRNLKIGTVLVRDYQGRRRTVTVAPEGCVWESASYSSLSASHHRHGYPNKDIQTYAGVGNLNPGEPLKKLCPSQAGGNN
jgi:hypothetical protein